MSETTPKKQLVAVTEPKSCEGSGTLFWLSIALGVALIVVIILIIVYASKTGSTSSNQIDIVAVEPSDEDYKKPLVLQGPLSQTDYKHVKPAAATLAEVNAASKEAKTLTADEFLQLLNNADGKSHPIVIVAGYCGACKHLKNIISSLADPSAVAYLDVSEFKKLDKAVKDKMDHTYVPQFFKVGPHGAVHKGPTGAIKEAELQSYISTA